MKEVKNGTESMPSEARTNLDATGITGTSGVVVLGSPLVLAQGDAIGFRFTAIVNGYHFIDVEYESAV